MPSVAEAAFIQKYREFNVMVENDTRKTLTPEQIRDTYPMVATHSGKASSLPNMFWAMEREIDARLEEMYSPNCDGDRKKILVGEMRGVAIGLSMISGLSIEELAISAMTRYRERHNG